MTRFTIRDVLWLTVVVALGAGWCLEGRRIENLRDKDAEHYSEMWDKREKEWLEANQWWRDAKDAWMRQQASKES